MTATSLVFAAPASAEDAADWRVDLPTTASQPTVIAASGGSVVLDVGTTSPNYWVTDNDGASYTRIIDRGLSVGVVEVVRDGKLVTAVPADGDGSHTSVYVHDLATGTTADPVSVPAASVEAADADTAVFTDGDSYRADDLATGTLTTLDYTPATSGTVVALLGGGADVLMAQLTLDSSGRPSTGYLDLVPLDGSAPAVPRVVVPGLAAVALRGDQVVYSTATPATTFNRGQSLCFLSVDAWSTPSCTSLAISGISDQRLVSHELSAGETWVQWSITSAAGVDSYVVAGTAAPGQPAVIDVTDDTTLNTVGDPDRPVASVTEGDTGYVGAVGTDGAITQRFAFPDAPAAETSLELTPDRLAGLDNRGSVGTGTYRSWQRSITETGLGDEEQPFPRALDLGTSGARTLLNDGTKLRLYDHEDAVRTLPLSKYGSLPGLISGPYFPAYSLSYLQALNVEGTVLKSATIRGLFGSLVLVRTSAPLGRYDVVDIATGDSVRVEVPLTYRRQGFDLAGLWGDWAYGYTFDSSLVPYTLAFNYRTGKNYKRYGLPVDYGDGFVLMKYADTNADGDDVTSLEAWNPATGQAETIPDADWDQVVTDGTSRIAYSTATELVLRDLTVVPTSRARLLGALAPSTLNLVTQDRSWPLELDTTKPLDAGTLTITDAAGTVVRTLDTEASADGSLRDLAWDGRDEAGDDVPTGTYSWNLVAQASDGTGTVVGVDGLADVGDTAETEGVSGRISVVKQYLGTASGPTPTISGTARVDRTLTAVPGSWTPSDADLTYAWYRTTSKGTTAITGATGSTYKVSATDVGATLSVRVTGTREGWKPATKTSKATATVAKATLTQTPVPTIDDPTPTVGNTLTANPRTWEPVPVSLAFAWYRVSSKGKVSAVLGRSATYTVQSADAGYRLKVKVTGTKAGYTTVTKESALTSKVAKA